MSYISSDGAAKHSDRRGEQLVDTVCKKRKNNNNDDVDNTRSVMLSELLDWTRKQGRILTAEGKYVNFYPSNSFEQSELPHFHLMNCTTYEAFKKFRASMNNYEKIPENLRNVVCGVWKRPLFMGIWEHSSDHEETVYNIQTNTLFVDIRIPNLRDDLVTKVSNFDRSENYHSLNFFSNADLKILSRQHAFAGYTIQGSISGRTYCTRHHCIDWNFIPNLSDPRPRPNKWWVEMSPDYKLWKEWAFATDSNNQHYYVERWERLSGDDYDKCDQFVLAMRCVKDSLRDGIVVIVGKHLNFIHGRRSSFEMLAETRKSTVELVDLALEGGNRKLALTYLEVEAGHATLSDEGWIIDKCTLPQREKCILDRFTVCRKLTDACLVSWEGNTYEVIECSCPMENLSLIINGERA